MKWTLPLLIAIGSSLVNAAALKVEKRDTATTTQPPNAQDTSSKLAELWKGLDIETADITTTVEGKPLPTSELAPPPNMPDFDFDSKWKLPKDFVFGFAGASYQIEGAAADDGKGPSIWDVITHAAGNDTGDVADNHYYLYQQDAQRLKALDIPYYSLTISWPRIFPFGKGEVNQAGLQHYIDEVDYLIKLGIEPIITLFHWDLPLALQNEYGGWADEKIIDDFANYAQVIFDTFGDKVRYWFTINEPEVISMQYQQFVKLLPPDLFNNNNKTADEIEWIVGHNLLLAHAKAAEIFNKQVKPRHPDRELSVKHSFQLGLPFNDDDENVKASERSIDFNAGWFIEPLYGNGDYPQSMRDTLGDKLPQFTKEQKQSIKGSTDFLSWDGYSSNVVKAPKGGVDACAKNPKHELYPACAEVSYVQEDGWAIGESSTSDWLYTTPDLVRASFNYMQKRWKPKGGFMITEWGFSDNADKYATKEQMLYDTTRSDYFEKYMTMFLKLVHVDKINFRGAIAWSVLDNLEWTSGFSYRFGLQYVDFETQERRFRKSAFVFSKFFNKLVEGRSGKHGDGDHHHENGHSHHPWWNWWWSWGWF